MHYWRGQGMKNNIESLSEWLEMLQRDYSALAVSITGRTARLRVCTTNTTRVTIKEVVCNLLGSVQSGLMVNEVMELYSTSQCVLHWLPSWMLQWTTYTTNPYWTSTYKMALTFLSKLREFKYVNQGMWVASFMKHKQRCTSCNDCFHLNGFICPFLSACTLVCFYSVI